MSAYLTTPLNSNTSWPLSFSSIALTTAWSKRHTLHGYARQTSADLCAEEGVGQNRVADVAVAESDELEIIDGDDVTCRENDVVHTVHVDERRAADAAGKDPFASKENWMPGSDKNGGGV
jgi:hypothetical protein